MVNDSLRAQPEPIPNGQGIVTLLPGQVSWHPGFTIANPDAADDEGSSMRQRSEDNLIR